MIRQMLRFSLILACAASACVAQDPEPGMRPPVLLPGMTPDEDSRSDRETPVVRAVRRAADSVVSIYVIRGSENLERGADGQGSGVILDEDGLVITNWHVVAQMTAGGYGAVVKLQNGAQIPADLLSSSPDHDLALLQLRTKEKVQAIEAADSEDLMIGETVIAIGNPQGLANSVTVGVLSSIDRGISVRTPDGVVRRYEGLLQTDAAINQGNSGGALLDITGRLIGINNAMAVGVENIGYAIPVNTVRRVFEDVLVSSENLARVWFGMRVHEVEGSAVVVDLNPVGPAARAGLRRGDVIVNAGGREVETALDYARSSLAAESGKVFPIRVKRGDDSLRLAVQPWSREEADLLKRTGLQLEAISASEDRELLEAISYEFYNGSRRRTVPLLPSTLRVVSVLDGSPAGKLGLRPDDILIAAVVPQRFGRSSYRAMRTVPEFAEVARVLSGRTVPILIYRDDKALEGRLEIGRQ